MVSTEGDYLRPEDIRFGPWPLGEWLNNGSTLSDDRLTYEGLEAATNQLASGGLVLMDTHPDLRTMLHSGITALEQLPVERVVFPVANFWYGFPGLRQLLWEQLGEDARFTVVPVRRADATKDGFWERIGFAPSLAPEQVAAAHEAYIETTMAFAETPHHLIGLAPQGSRLDEANFRVRRGVVELLQNGAVGLLTHTQPVEGTMVTYFGPELFSVPGDTSRADITAGIADGFNELFTRSGSPHQIPVGS